MARWPAAALVLRRRCPVTVLAAHRRAHRRRAVVAPATRAPPSRMTAVDRPLHRRLAHRPPHHLARRPAHHDRPDRRRDALRAPPLVRAGEPRHLRLDRHGRRRRRRRPQPPRLRRRHPGARRAGRAHPRGGGPAPRRRGAPADRPRPARRRRPPHRPGQRPGRGRLARHGQAPRPGQGGPRPRPRGQPLRAQRTPRHRRPAAAVRRPRGAHRAGPGPRRPRRARRHASAARACPSRWPAPTGGTGRCPPPSTWPPTASSRRR